MSSHPDGGVPQGQQQLDISKADTITCDECGNASFIPVSYTHLTLPTTPYV